MTTASWKLATDKVVGLVTLDEVSKAFVKATNHEITPPKEKHVQSKFL